MINNIGLKHNPGPPPDNRKHVFICSGCGESIYEGDDYWEYFGEQFCKYCNDYHHQIAEAIDE